MALNGIEVVGTIIKEYPPKEGTSQRSGNPWKSQEFVIQTTDQYPRACQFRVFGADRLEQFKLKQGDSVRVWLDINAHAWQDRYFNDINAYQVEHLDSAAVGEPQPTPRPQTTAAPQPTATGPQPASTAPAADTEKGSQDDLPF